MNTMHATHSSFYTCILEGTEKKYTIEILTVVRKKSNLQYPIDKKRSIQYAVATCASISPDTACISGKEADTIIDNNILPVTAYAKFVTATKKKAAYVATKKAQQKIKRQ